MSLEDKKDPLRPKEDIRITDKDTGFLNTLKSVMGTTEEEDATCPKHKIIGKYIPPSERVGHKLHVKYECPEGHTFTKILDLM